MKNPVKTLIRESLINEMKERGFEPCSGEPCSLIHNKNNEQSFVISFRIVWSHGFYYVETYPGIVYHRVEDIRLMLIQMSKTPMSLTCHPTIVCSLEFIVYKKQGVRVQWRTKTEEGVSALVHEIIGAVEQYAFPFYKEFGDLESLMRIMTVKLNPNRLVDVDDCYTYPIVLYLLGKRIKGRMIVNQFRWLGLYDDCPCFPENYKKLLSGSFVDTTKKPLLSSYSLRKMSKVIHTDLEALLSRNGFVKRPKGPYYYRSAEDDVHYQLGLSVSETGDGVHIIPSVGVVYDKLNTLYEQLCSFSYPTYSATIAVHDMNLIIPLREGVNRQQVSGRLPKKHKVGRKEWCITHLDERQYVYADMIRCFNQYALPFFQYYGQFDHMLESLLKNEQSDTARGLYAPAAFYLLGDYKKGMREMRRGMREGVYGPYIFSSYPENYLKLLSDAKCQNQRNLLDHGE